jgi:hypothetical protein
LARGSTVRRRPGRNYRSSRWPTGTSTSSNPPKQRRHTSSVASSVGSNRTIRRYSCSTPRVRRSTAWATTPRPRRPSWP